MYNLFIDVVGVTLHMFILRLHGLAVQFILEVLLLSLQVIDLADEINILDHDTVIVLT